MQKAVDLIISNNKKPIRDLTYSLPEHKLEIRTLVIFSILLTLSL